VELLDNPDVSKMPDSLNPGSAASLTNAAAEPVLPPDPVLCQHCGRTASNGISCQGSCVADSGY
jgi:hypothetical protein